MTIASISSWLSDPARSYLQGRILYETYGDDPVILAIITTGSGSFHANKLYQALEELNQAEHLVPKPIQIPDFIPAAAAGLPGKEKTDLKDAPALIREIRDEKNLKFAQARKLHQEIPFMDSQENRLKASLAILDLMDNVNQSWATIDKFVQEGQVPEAPAAPVTDDISQLPLSELLRESKNLPSYISKFKKKISVAKDKAAQLKLTLQLQAHEDRLRRIKERLSNDFN